jgi:hypothetical protein
MSVLAAAAIGVSAWWAFKPLAEADLAIPSFELVGPEGSRVELSALDVSAFSAPLWVAPPAPPPAPAPPPPPPSLKLQLIAIVREGGADGEQGATSAALFYDPDSDRLVTLRAGDRIAGRTIERVTSASVELREGAATRTLVLADSGPAVPGAGGVK